MSRTDHQDDRDHIETRLERLDKIGKLRRLRAQAREAGIELPPADIDPLNRRTDDDAP